METDRGFCPLPCHKDRQEYFINRQYKINSNSCNMKKVILSIIIALLILPGCGSMKNMSREDRVGLGAQAGSILGWLFGGLLGEAINDERGGEIGSFVGTAVGGIAGASIAASADDEIRTERRSPGKYTSSSHTLLPDLQIEDILLEEDSLTCNQKIDAGETCRISLVMVNNSFQEAVDVVPIVKIEEGEELELSDPVRIPRISRDDCITYEVTVYASPKLQTGKAVFSVRLKEGRGNGTEEELFTIETVGNEDK